MQDNFNIHEWRLQKSINELEEKQLCEECGEGYMEEGQCVECGYMKEGATFTDKYDDNPELKGGQKKLPDELQAGILKKEITSPDAYSTEYRKGYKAGYQDGKENKYPVLENEDHEVSMAQNSLQSIISSASQLINKIGNNERNIPGWIQDHITNAENYIDQANQGYHEL